MAEKQATKKNSLQTRWASFQSLSPQDKRRTVIDVLFNNAMYIIIILAIIFIAIRVPQFVSLSSSFIAQGHVREFFLLKIPLHFRYQKRQSMIARCLHPRKRELYRRKLRQ